MKTKIFLLLTFLWTPVFQAQAGPAEAEALYKEGYQKGMAQDLAGAAILFEKAIAADPNHFMAHFDLGGVKESLGDKDTALAEYLKTVGIKPDFIEAQAQAGTLLLLHQKKPEEAMEHFKSALLTKNPYVDPRFSVKHSHDQALLNTAVAMAIKGEFGVAYGIARSYAHNPTVTGGRSAGNLQTLASRASADMNVKREFAALLTPLGKDLYGGKPAEALKAYRDFEKTHDLSKVPPMDLWDLYSGMGIASVILKDYAAAEEYTSKALAYTPRLPAKLQIESRFNLACFQSINGRIDAALKEIESVLWYDFLTKYDPDVDPKNRKTPKVATDADLSNLRKDPRFQPLFGKYTP